MSVQNMYERIKELEGRANQLKQRAVGETSSSMDPYAVYTGDLNTPMDPELLLIRDTFAGVWMFAMSDRPYLPLAARMERWIRLVESLMARKTRIADAAYIDVSGYPMIGLGFEGMGPSGVHGLNDLIPPMQLPAPAKRSKTDDLDESEEAERDAGTTAAH